MQRENGGERDGGTGKAERQTSEKLERTEDIVAARREKLYEKNPKNLEKS